MTRYLPIILLLLLQISSYAQAKKQAAANTLITAIQKQYAPDKRVAVYDYSTKVEGKNLLLIGMSNLPEARQALLNALAAQQITFTDQSTLLPEAALGDKTFGIVKASVANIRGEAKHSAEMVTQAILGTPLNVLRKQGGWYLVQTPDQYLGWVETGAFAAKTSEEMQAWRSAERLIFMGDHALCYAATDDTAPLSDIVAGSILAWDAESSRLIFPDGRSTLLPEGPWMSLHDWANRTAAHQDSLLQTAFRYGGRPYLWGGTSGKGLDCSGFTRSVYYLHGAIIPRDASQQALAGTEVPLDEQLSALIPGDFLFFGSLRDDGSKRITHVGIYVGEGQFIHSGSDKGYITTDSLRPGDPGYSPARRQSLLQAQRLRPATKDVVLVRNSGWYF